MLDFRVFIIFHAGILPPLMKQSVIHEYWHSVTD